MQCIPCCGRAEGVLAARTPRRPGHTTTVLATPTTPRSRHCVARHPLRHCIECSSASNYVVQCVSPRQAGRRIQRQTLGASKSPRRTTHWKSRACYRGSRPVDTPQQDKQFHLQGVPVCRFFAAKLDSCPGNEGRLARPLHSQVTHSESHMPCRQARQYFGTQVDILHVTR